MPPILQGQSPSFVRTLVPLLIGPLLARYGFSATDPTVLMVLSAALGYAYYVIVRVVEHYFPTFGYLLGIAKAPVYSTAPSPSPSTGQTVTAVVTDDLTGAVVEDTGVPAPDHVVQTDNRPRPGIDPIVARNQTDAVYVGADDAEYNPVVDPIVPPDESTFAPATPAATITPTP